MHATKSYALKASGFQVLGQEKDSIGGGFDRTQTLYGRLASVNMWEKVLSESDIAAQYTNAAYLMVLFLTGLHSKILLMAMSQLKSPELHRSMIKTSAEPKIKAHVM